jgi:23S rRNA (pseudouridine1915-N3)-methyltransferase
VKFLIIAVGNKIPAWAEAGIHEYLRRMPPEITVEIKEVKPEKRNQGKNIGQILVAESQRVMAAVPPQYRTVVLDRQGKQYDTVRLAESVTRWGQSGTHTAFIIGSADGLAEHVIASADETLTLSALTLPHGLARLVLAEQLYRAISLIRRHPYHRE